MTNGLYTAAVGSVPQVFKEDVISNNLANINTSGFKKEGVVFKRILDAQLYPLLYRGDDQFLPNADDTYTNFQQGSLVDTHNSLDVALVGNGFFAVQTPQGTAYTRSGNFTINDQKQMVTQAGYPVLGENGVIELDDTRNLVISEQGELLVDGAQVNKFMLVNFQQPATLRKLGNGLYATDVQTNPQQTVTDISTRQGFLEQSNVNAVQEMVEMLKASNFFDTIQRTLRLQNDILGKTVNELGRFK
jgi:flagellar basal-body rod protein FlgF